MKIDRILIIRLSSLGDILLATPLIRWLRNKFPVAQIDFAVKERFAGLLRKNPHLNKLRILSEAGDYAALKKLTTEIRQSKYNIIIDLHSNLRSRFISAFSGARVYRWEKPTFRRWMLIKFKKNSLQDYPPVPLRYLKAIAELEVEEDDGEGLEYSISEATEEMVSQMWSEYGLDDKTVIAIAPGAKWKTKQWLTERYSELGKKFITLQEFALLVLGSQSEAGLCHIICNEIGDKVIDLSGKTDFDTAAALIGKCNLFIGNDSGLGHLAAAVETPSVIIFGPTVKEFGFFPFRHKSIVLEKEVYCRPCSHIGSEQCPQGHFRCMKEIEVDEVYQAALRLLN